MITSEAVASLANKWKIDVFTVWREYLQVAFLQSLSQHKLSGHFYFKGGTTIRLLLQSFRFSEDLDFTATVSTKEIQSLLPEVVGDLNKTIPQVESKESKAYPVGLTSWLKMKLEGYKQLLVVRLQFSVREKPLTVRDSLLETMYPIVPNPIVRHLDWEEILAEKVRALLVREAGRDLFDLWYLRSKGIALNWDFINAKMKLYDKTASLEELKNRISSFDLQILKQDLGQFLPHSHRAAIPQLISLALKNLS